MPTTSRGWWMRTRRKLTQYTTQELRDRLAHALDRERRAERFGEGIALFNDRLDEQLQECRARLEQVIATRNEARDELHALRQENAQLRWELQCAVADHEDAGMVEEFALSGAPLPNDEAPVEKLRDADPAQAEQEAQP